MFAVQYSEYGGPEVLSLGEAPEPHAGPGQVRIVVRAASVNPIDWKVRAGMMAGGQPLEGTGIPGVDASGVVDEIGEGVTGVSIGDDVFGLGSSTQAEFAVLNAWAVKPSSVDWSAAAAAALAAETAERGLRMLGVKQGMTVFIDGGAGGVGSAAVQLAKAAAANVIASASQDNHDYLREIGAAPVLYGDGLLNRVRAIPDSHIDAVFDVAGKTAIEDLIALAPEPSQVVSIANFGAAAAGARLSAGGEESQPFQSLNLAAQLLHDSRLVIKVQTFPFDRFAEAYLTSESGHTRGKLVLVP
ncbi:MAG TPA: NADP-dependent oxidoreductase [Propionibacteriaceae bacterium]